MKTLLSNRLLRTLLALVAVTLLGTAGALYARLTSATATVVPVPERLEWHQDPRSGAASLLLHGVEGHPGEGVLVPVHDDLLPFPGHPALWKELLAAWQSAPPAGARDGFDGLQLMDPDRQSGLMPRTLLPLPATPFAAAVRGRLLWLVSPKSGLLVVDLTEPARPEIRTAWPAPWADHVVFAGDRVFLLDVEGRLDIVELDSAGQAWLFDSYNLQQAGARYEGLTVRDDRLLLVKRNLRSEDKILSHCRLTPSGRLDLPFSESPLPFRIREAWWRGARLYLQQMNGDLLGIDCAEPARPSVVLKTALPDRIEMLAGTGRLGVMQLADGSIYLLDDGPAASHAPTVRFLGREPGALRVLLTVVDGRLYALSGERGLQVFPELPTLSALDREGRGVPPPADAASGPSGQLWSKEVQQALALPGGRVILDKAGEMRLFAAAGGEASAGAGFAAGRGARWLAAGNDRVYVGGGETIAVLRADARGNLQRTGGLAVPGGRSFDAVVVEHDLFVAAGRLGVLGYSLADPDHPVAGPGWQPHQLLSQRLDVRDLAVQGRQLFAAGGAAGLLVLSVDRDHRVVPVGIRPLDEPVLAVAVAGRLVLAVTKKSIHLLAMSHPGEGADLQLVGALPIRNVTRLQVFDSQYLGVRQAVGGWLLLPLPVLMTGQPGDPPGYRLPAAVVPGRYQLLMLNRAGVTEWPGILTIPDKAQGRGRES